MALVLKEFYRAFLDLIYPPACLLCKKNLPPQTEGDALCLSCLNKIEFNAPPFCQKCSRSLDAQQKETVCRQCQSIPYHFDRIWAATVYNQTMQDLIHLFKYRDKTALRKTFLKLIFLFIERYQIDLRPMDVVIPAPLHPARLRERGFNQSLMLSEGISKKFSIPLPVGSLIKKRHTRHQALLGKKERWTNIHGAFTITSPSVFKDKSVLVVDDLLTTGATASEIARTLKENGAKSVYVLTLAIATS